MVGDEGDEGMSSPCHVITRCLIIRTCQPSQHLRDSSAHRIATCWIKTRAASREGTLV